MYLRERGRRDDSAQFHALCPKTRVVIFFYLPCRKPDLVAIGTKTRCSLARDFVLRQLARERLFCACGVRAGIARTRYAHCLIHPRPPRKRIAYCPANARGGSSKRLNFRGMVVGFVFEHQKPRLSFARFKMCVNVNRTRVDFFGFLKVVELAVSAELFCADERYVHERYRLIRRKFFFERAVRFERLFKRRLKHAVFYRDAA